MLSAQDKDWLGQNYPKLTVGLDIVYGVLDFKATYNPETGQFLILGDGIESTIGGRVLDVSYEILIKERSDKKHSALPALEVKNLILETDRHFSPDGTACLCSPFEEDEFLIPSLQFPKFFRELIMPFLYGQTFYTQEKKWPWPDLAHGVTGLLESYHRLKNPNLENACISLSKFREWPQIKSLLSQSSDIKGHTICFCPKHDHMRRCHVDALKALRKLRIDVKSRHVNLP